MVRTNIIEALLDKINSEALLLKNDKSLITGQSGCSLFSILYDIHFKQNALNENLVTNIQSIVDEHLDTNSNALSNGNAGIYLFFHYLYKLEYITHSDFKEIVYNTSTMKMRALELLEDGNYDFLHGAIGIAHSILKIESYDSNFLNIFFQKLYDLFGDGEYMLERFNFKTFRTESGEVDLGLAHGVTSVLKFCLECYAIGICPDESTFLANKIITYLKNQHNDSGTESCYGNIISKEGKTNGTSRLAWCYGDLCIGFVLYQASRVFEDSDLGVFSLNVLKHTTKRNTFSKTRVNDGGICHGSAGIAHIYNKVWHLTGETCYKMACDFWIERTIEYSTFKDTKSGFKKYLAVEKEFVPDSGLLEGSAGIGLVLLSYLTDDFTWDYSIMLNNL